MYISACLPYFQAFSYVAAAIAAVFAASTYFRNSNQERATWLFELYSRLYDSSSHNEIRNRIESGDTKFAESEADELLLMKLDNYLNFFEFICFLVNHNRLKRSEVLAMFDYPLRRILADNSIMRYVSRPEYGYQDLTAFLKGLSYSSN